MEVVTLTEAGAASNMNNYEVEPDGGDYQLTVTDGFWQRVRLRLRCVESGCE